MTAPSAADSLPNINFGFDELRDRMAKFTARFDDFIEKGRKRVLEERNQFAVTVAELEGTHRARAYTCYSHNACTHRRVTDMSTRKLQRTSA